MVEIGQLLMQLSIYLKYIFSIYSAMSTTSCCHSECLAFAPFDGYLKLWEFMYRYTGSIHVNELNNIKVEKDSMLKLIQQTNIYH